MIKSHFSFSMIALSFAVAEMVGENMGNDNLRKGFWDPKQASIPITFGLITP